MSNDVLSKIQAGMSGFSKGQRLIANYIIASYDKAAFMTASKLGRTVKVSESTVVRFAVELGYEGYPTLQKALQEVVRNKLTSVQRMEVAADRIGDQDILTMVMHTDMEKIRATMDELDRVTFHRVVDAILEARKIYILGIRSSSPLASFLGYYLSLMLDNVQLINSSSTSEVFEQVVRVQEGDVMLGISFPRYSSRTVKAMKYAKERGATVVALTDSPLSPIAAHADHSLLAKSDIISLVDSLVAPLSVVNALLVAVGQRKEKELTRTFMDLERIWDEYEVYEKSEN